MQRNQEGRRSYDLIIARPFPFLPSLQGKNVMKILLVPPRVPDTFWSFKHALRFISKKAGEPPLGLLTVAAMLPAEWQKALVDLNVRPIDQRQTVFLCPSPFDCHVNLI